MGLSLAFLAPDIVQAAVDGTLQLQVAYGNALIASIAKRGIT